jgi:hypothetical protein
MTDEDRLAKDSKNSKSNRERASGTAFKDRGRAIFSGFLLGGFVFILVVVFLQYRARVREAGRARSPTEDQEDLVTFPIVPEKEGTPEPHSDDWSLGGNAMTDDRLSYIRITAIRTVDPSDYFMAKNSFSAPSPFGIAMDVAVTSSLTQIGLLYDAYLQVVNPRNSRSAYDWVIYREGSLLTPSEWTPVTTVDRYYADIPLVMSNFLVGTSWVRFDRITDGMWGSYANRNSGIFLARGSVNVQGTDLFDVSEDVPFKVEV